LSYRVQFSSKNQPLFKDNAKITFQDKRSTGYMQNIEIEDGLSLIKSDIKFEKSYDLEINNDSKSMLFAFLLDGSSNYNASSYNVDISSKKDHTTVIMDNNSNGVKRYHKNTHLKSIQLFLKEEYLQKILPREFFEHNLVKRFNKNSDFLESLKYGKTDYKTKINIYEIFNTPFDESLNKLYIQSKVCEVLYTELKDLFSSNVIKKSNREIKFSSYDKEALYKAKDILIQNMINPPSLSELSKSVKLNEYKLKYGFKEFFNTSPYGLLLEYKMQKAKKLLLKSEYDINEISLEVGYVYPHNFTKAFFKRFGVLPKDIMKTRKYYY